MMDMLLYDEELRESVIRRQSKRLKGFNNEALEKKLRGYLSPWLSS
jgi:hypothetical protein